MAYTRKELDTLRKVLAKQVIQPIYFRYHLTIRQYQEIFKIASGGRGWGDYHLEDKYDLDSEEDLLKWVQEAGHAVDLEYASISLYACSRRLYSRQRMRELTDQVQWLIKLQGHPGHPFSIALYTKRLQDAQIRFYLDESNHILDAFDHRYSKYEFEDE